MIKLQLGVNEGVDNADYHGDKDWVSSSVLKDVLKSADDYHYYHTLGNSKTFGNGDALIEGSLTHSILLEPHQTDNDFAYYTGFRKQGADYDAFVLLNQGKTIVGQGMRARVLKYVEACKRDAEAQELLKTFKPEHTVCVEIEGVRIKVRADGICVDRGLVLDIKTTSGSADFEGAAAAVDKFSYDMSAALYCMAFEQHYGKPFDFYWIFISKSEQESRTYKVSKETMARGRSAVKLALKRLKIIREHNVTREIDMAQYLEEAPKVYTGLDDIQEL